MTYLFFVDDYYNVTAEACVAQALLSRSPHRKQVALSGTGCFQVCCSITSMRQHPRGFIDLLWDVNVYVCDGMFGDRSVLKNIQSWLQRVYKTLDVHIGCRINYVGVTQIPSM